MRGIKKLSTSLFISALVAVQSPSAVAQGGAATKLNTDWSERYAPRYELQPYDEGLLGDSIDLQTGGLSFEVVDVALPGNSDLEVAVRRRRNASQSRYQEFNDWPLSIPMIKTNIPEAAWVSVGRWGASRCNSPLSSSLPTFTRSVAGSNRTVPPSDYSHGVILDIPGQGSQQILDAPQGTIWPAGAKKVTAGGWYLTCISNIDGSGTEGFYAFAPNGDRYRFDKKLERRRVSKFQVWFEYINYNPYQLSVDYYTDYQSYDILAATEIRDRNGNTVQYQFDGNDRLASIVANDGRRIDLSYSGSGTLIVGATASPGTADERSWAYNYDYATISVYNELASSVSQQWKNETYGVLNEVVLPDGRYWEYNIGGLIAQAIPGSSATFGSWNRQCKQKNQTVTVKHPDGVTGTFVLTEKMRDIGGQGPVNGPNCPNSTGGSQAVRWSDVMTVSSKALTAPGIETAVWQYTYYDALSPNATWNRTDIVRPDGSLIRYQFQAPYLLGNPMPASALTRQELFSTVSSTTPVERIDYEYLREAAVGTLFIPSMGEGSLKPIRQTQASVIRGSDTYTTTKQYNTNTSSSGYSFGQPTQITESSTLGSGTRTTLLTYHHDTDDWVMAQVETITRNTVTSDEYFFDDKGRITGHDKFGVRIGTYTYYTSGVEAGQISSYKDAINRYTYFRDWHRGAPREIEQPDGEEISATVDSNGWVTSATDAAGYTTSFAYDSVGRMTGIDLPAPWADTSITYTYPTTGVNLAATRGSERITITYDNMLRPKLVKTEDTGTGWASYVRTEYDAMGRAVFSSFPSSSSSAPDGTTTTYDGLGRVVLTQENVVPYADVQTSYGANNCITVTDAENYSTTTCRSGYGSPDDGQVISISQPESITTTMTYDIFGNLLTASQGGFTQTWKYDSRNRVCQYYTPETGTTYYDYDNANQLIAYDEGKSWSASTCPAPTASKVQLTYDDMGRLKNTLFPAGTESIYRTYDDVGNLLTVNRGGANWTYTYLAGLNLLNTETLTIDGRTYLTDYDYNANGAMTQMVYPGGRTIAYAPDGLGRPTGAQIAGGAVLASGAAYHPNGVLSAYNLGNGLAFSQTLTPRQMPLRRKITGSGVTAIDFEYSYTVRGQINATLDRADIGNDRTYFYDGVGRLETASGPWGSVTYSYDTTGNLLSKAFGSRTVSMTYNPSNNRLATVTDSAFGGGYTRAITYDARGNITHDDYRGFTYDWSNQPTGLTGPANATYVYDGNMRRVKETVNGVVTYSIYGASGQLTQRERTVVFPETVDFVSFDGGSLARIKGSTITYTYVDHLGTPVRTSTTATGLSAFERYSPYGENLTPPSANDSYQGFTGHIEDGSGTGLAYMQARYYDPVFGRFLSKDPVGFVEGGPGYFNRYWYTMGDPVNAIDPDGRQAVVARACTSTPQGVAVCTAALGTVALSVYAASRLAPTTMGSRYRTEIITIDEWLRRNEPLTNDSNAPADAPNPGNEEPTSDTGPSIQDLSKVGSNKKADKIAQEHGYEDAHDAKDGRGQSEVNIYKDKKTGEYYIWDGKKDSEPEPL